MTRCTARIGLLVPFTNTNLEPDIALLSPPDVSVHSARLGGYDIDATPDAEQMAELGASDMGEPLRLLAGVRPDVVLYGCTSATLSHGVAFDRDLGEQVAAASGARTVTAAGALVTALAILRATRIAFASPYVPAMNDEAIAFLADSGIATVSRADYPVALGNYGQGEVTPDAVFDLGMRADGEDADAIVLSCTDMRAVEAVERLEAATGKPVVTSNQAMMRVALDLLGHAHAPAGFGRLLSERGRA